jgi:hypothetical protein
VDKGLGLGAELAAAQNLLVGDNPPYSPEQFKAAYPQFEGLVPDNVCVMYINLARASLQQKRWEDAWEIGVGWFVAHFLTLYLQSKAAPGSPAGAVIAAGTARGLQTSKAVDGVSVSYDYAAAVKDLDGWAAWTLTVYGQQLASYAKMLTGGGIYVV